MVCRRGNAVRKLKNLRTVLGKIIKQGIFFGYHVETSKSQLILKDGNYNEALKVFKNTGIKMKKGARVLGSVIESETECKTFLEPIEKKLLDREHITRKSVLLLNHQFTAK